MSTKYRNSRNGRSMTLDEALNLKRFDHPCTCGGHAHSMNGRDPAGPHMNYCPQWAQYNEWYRLTQQEDEDDE